MCIKRVVFNEEQYPTNVRVASYGYDVSLYEHDCDAIYDEDDNEVDEFRSSELTVAIMPFVENGKLKTDFDTLVKVAHILRGDCVV